MSKKGTALGGEDQVSDGWYLSDTTLTDITLRSGDTARERSTYELETGKEDAM